MSIVGFVLHPQQRDARRLLEQAVSYLQRQGHQSVELDPSHGGGVDLAVSLGGDGTMLRAVDMVIRHSTPVMGVNLGNLGYLAEVEPEEMEGALKRFFTNDYEVEERMTVGCTVRRKRSDPRSQGEAEAYLALNEVVVERESSGHVVRMDVVIDGTRFLRYDADGLIVSSPTGSTAYSLSARGPILSPDLQALILTPITPHMLFDRAMVLRPTSTVTVEICSGPSGSLMVDGRVASSLTPGDAAVCTAGSLTAKLVRLKRRDFHDILKSKFGLRSNGEGEK